MKPYSVDLRERIVQAVNDVKMLREDAAKQFRISLASVNRFLQLHRDLGNLEPLFSTGRPRLIRAEDEHRLLEQVQANNDLTLKEHCKLWKKTMKQTVSVTCMFESQKRAKITLKKSQSKLENATK